MGTFNFKSVGKTREQQLIEKLVVTQIPIGIKTPLQLGTDDLFVMNMTLLSQIQNNLRDLILTNWGERLGLYEFGANLRKLTTELVNQDDFDATAVKQINDAVGRWMPYVSLEDYVSEIDHKENKNTGIIKITITYTVPTLNSGKLAIQVLLYVI